MASRGSKSTSPPPTTTTSTNHANAGKNNHNNNSSREESFLSRKKKEIVDRSMALFQSRLNRCLDNSAAAAAAVSSGSSAAATAAAGAGGVVAEARRRVKRGREDDEHVEEVGGGGVKGGGIGVGGVKKKRGNPKEVDNSAKTGKRFACPFCKHDPGKYKSVKTCCGPGWEDVHRVKEHIYRRHSWKSTRVCPRCFSDFDKPELLKAHQRASVPCELRERAQDAITEEQEKQLRLRAKTDYTEEMKWEEMYQIIFPGETVPSPYYDSSNDSASAKAKKSQFQNIDQLKDYLRREVPRVVRAAMEQYVDVLFMDLQDKVDRKTVEIIRDVETTMLRTFHFQEELSTVAAATVPPAAPDVGGAAGGATLSTAETNPPSSPGPEMAKVTQLLGELRDDPHYNELCSNLHFDVDDLLASAQGFGCDNFSVDSAYWTGSSTGGQGSFSVGGDEFLHRY